MVVMLQSLTIYGCCVVGEGEKQCGWYQTVVTARAASTLPPRLYLGDSGNKHVREKRALYTNTHCTLAMGQCVTPKATGIHT